MCWRTTLQNPSTLTALKKVIDFLQIILIKTFVQYFVRTFGYKGKPYRIKIFDVVIRKEVFCIRGKYITCFKIGSITV